MKSTKLAEPQFKVALERRIVLVSFDLILTTVEKPFRRYLVFSVNICKHEAEIQIGPWGSGKSLSCFADP
jgi:hypothetical protein